MGSIDLLSLERAAGAVLRTWRRPGVALQRLQPGARAEPLRPALAIQALLAGMRARFALTPEAAAASLAPALADWRDAVGCADLLLVAANAATEKQLLPLPMPSWCAWLIDAGLLRLEGPPQLHGPRVVQPAWLLAVRESELSAVECFPLVLAGRAAPASVHVHLALSPPFLGEGWRGPVTLRAGASRDGPAVPCWLGAPSAPTGAPAEGVSGQGAVTWSVGPAGEPAPAGSGEGADAAAEAPASWPRWAVLRLLEGPQPQALWELPALWRARVASPPATSATAAAPVSIRLALDVGSTATVVVEEDEAVAGAVGSKLFGSGPAPSGFLRLAGEPRTAHRFGCGEQLLAPGGQLPTALCTADPRTLAQVLRGERGAEQLWLPQRGEGEGAAVRADRFKSPELLLLSDWLADAPGAPDPAQASRRLLEAYGLLLGRSLAAAHAAPLVTSEGGRWVLRSPRLGAAEAIVTYPQCAWSSGSAESFRSVLDGVGRELCRGLCAAWASAAHRMLPDPVAAKAARELPPDERLPIEVTVDFGGLTLQISARVPQAAGRPAPLIPGTSMSYLLGGERLIEAAAYAGAGLGGGELRESYRAIARGLRQRIGAPGPLPPPGPEAAALRDCLLDTVLALVRRQLAGTLRRAAPELAGLRGAGVRLNLLGEGWKLLGLDLPDDRREAEALQRLRERLAREPLLPGAGLEIERMDKRRLCEGALRVRAHAGEPAEAIELQGVDTGGQRWFGLAGASADPHPAPLRDDPWWQELSSGAEGSLLRVDQWFVRERPFESRLAGGRISFAPRHSLLKQWLDVSGPSLIALRVHDALRARRDSGAGKDATGHPHSRPSSSRSLI